MLQPHLVDEVMGEESAEEEGLFEESPYSHREWVLEEDQDDDGDVYAEDDLNEFDGKEGGGSSPNAGRLLRRTSSGSSSSRRGSGGGGGGRGGGSHDNRSSENEEGNHSEDESEDESEDDEEELEEEELKALAALKTELGGTPGRVRHRKEAGEVGMGAPGAAKAKDRRRVKAVSPEKRRLRRQQQQRRGDQATRGRCG